MKNEESHYKTYLQSIILHFSFLILHFTKYLSPVCLTYSCKNSFGYPGRITPAGCPIELRSNLPSLTRFTTPSLYFTIKNVPNCFQIGKAHV